MNYDANTITNILKALDAAIAIPVEVGTIEYVQDVGYVFVPAVTAVYASELDELANSVVALYKDGARIGSIKVLRSLTNCFLKEAKDAVEDAALRNDFDAILEILALAKQNGRLNRAPVTYYRNGSQTTNIWTPPAI